MAYLLAEAYLHRLDPFAIRFPASWPIDGIHWYGLSYLAGFAIAWLMVRWLARTHRTLLPPPSVADFMIYVLVGVLVGGRLGYCLFYDRSLLVSFTSRFPFWGLLAINRGGMASHGGFIGVILAMWIFSLRNRISFLHLLDVGALAAPPGLALGRLANFVNGELPGRVLPAAMQGASSPWWSIKYPAEIEHWSPAQLERLSGVVDAVGPSATEWRSALEQLPSGGEAAILVQSTIHKLIAAAQAGDVRVEAALRPLLQACYPSQFFQALTDGPLLLGLVILVWWGPRKPGVVGFSFLSGYAVLRIVSECFRQPDRGVATLRTPLGELSRGQVLSAVMLLIGIVGLLVVARREVEPIGGLRRQ